MNKHNDDRQAKSDDDARAKGFFSRTDRRLPRVKSNVRAGGCQSPTNYVAAA